MRNSGFNEGYNNTSAGGFSTGFTSLVGVVKSGLVMHLDAGNPASYSGTGTAWNDISGNGNNATLYNSPTYSAANGGLLTFAKASYGYAETNGNLGNMSRWTVEVWTKLNSLLTGGQNAFVANVYDGSNLNYSLGANNPASTPATAGFFNGAWRNASPGLTLSTGVWYHLAGTYDGATVKFYVNASVNSTLDYVGTPTSGGNTRIARRWDSVANDSGNFVDGSIPVVRVYNRSLDATEINRNFTSQRLRYGV